MAKQQRPNDIDDVAKQFSEGLSFSYAHLAGKCRRKILLDGFGESTEIQCPSPCCDVCQEEIGQLVDRRIELSILIKAIDELGKMGEVKVTEWIRGGQTAWMKNIPRSKAKAYGVSPTGLSKEWWRRFIHQFSAAGYILRLIRPLTYTQSIQGSYQASNQQKREGILFQRNNWFCFLKCWIWETNYPKKWKQRTVPKQLQLMYHL